MHVRYCECEACLPGTPFIPAAPVQRVRVEPVRKPRVRRCTREQKRAENARAYQKRKLRGVEA